MFVGDVEEVSIWTWSSPCHSLAVVMMEEGGGVREDGKCLPYLFEKLCRRVWIVVVLRGDCV